ncbi:hypothetical protein NL108_013024, partial [Boleophthalmus pectinirostris]
GFTDKQTIAAEQRISYHLEARLSATGAPLILSANVTRGLGRRTSFSASLKNMFRETASVSVAVERRRGPSSQQYSVEGELLLPGLLGGRVLGLLEQRASLWSSALRLKYGLGEEARVLHQECFTSQRLKSERDSNHSYIMRAEHQFYCSNTAAVNHKASAPQLTVQVTHEESSSLLKSHLDLSYGKHWDELTNKHRLILSQMFVNQSKPNHTSYTLEFSVQMTEKSIHHRTQLLHSHLKLQGAAESSTHLKVQYNQRTPLVMGLHWRGPPHSAPLRKWEGTLNMDSPWLYVHTSHRLSRGPHMLQLSSELTCSKSLSLPHLTLEALYRHRGRETGARMHLHSPHLTYLQSGGWVLVGKRSVRASCSWECVWTPRLGGGISLDTSRLSHSLEMTCSYGQYNASVTAALTSADKKLRKRHAILKMSWCELPGPPSDLLLEGEVEELKRDKKIFQKMAKLYIRVFLHRQPFQSFTYSLVLEEMFTADSLRGLYTLESRATISGDKELLHTLTISPRSPQAFICSALIHPFSSSRLPSESEMCLNLFNNQ